MTGKGYNRSRIMKAAHAEWRAKRGRPGWDFARCLRLSWAVERKRLAPREYYQPPITSQFSVECHI